MTDEEIQGFSKRVTQANQSELTVITCEIIINYIADAVQALETGEENNYVVYNKKAREFLRELMASINYDNEIAYNLIKIYAYMHRILVEAEYSRDKEKLNVASKLMSTFLGSFRDVAKKDDSPAVMENTQQVYAGLTYGKGYLNETMLDPGLSGRGFQA